ncbi:SpoIIIAH-like family protein [Gracilibacillus timonensis]|uniref:SpoIIIAH-like family protein n=1 Tax=Gracilibacillus timonensis TaxID=1816696 RepID=UPI00082564E7|nr:SpoIIIAH-like family protein [Gracilibacillus timonensis]
MIKKQTIWLLTMLSLMIVLSVYYLNAPRDGEMALFDDQEQDELTGETISSEEVDQVLDQDGEQQGDAAKEEDGTTAANLDEYFASVRTEISNQRSMEKERLESIVASSESSSDEVNQAYEAMKEIEMLDVKEGNLEAQLKAVSGYEGVLVRNVSDNNLVVTVQADNLTAEEANQIMLEAQNEFGDVKVDVEYHGNEG